MNELFYESQTFLLVSWKSCFRFSNVLEVQAPQIDVQNFYQASLEKLPIIIKMII